MNAWDERERIALVVHEVRSPTAPLATIVVALREGGQNETSLRTLVGLSLAACRSIDRILGDAALGSLRLESIDVAELAREAVAISTLGDARIRARIDTGLPLVLGDRVRLRQALDNLIENAVAACADQEIVVGVSARESTVVLSVADLGPGIPVEAQGRIFEPGVTLGSPGAGKGLGLAIARSIAEAHGGTAAVHSQQGRGATLTISLPVGGPHPAGTTFSS